MAEQERVSRISIQLKRCKGADMWMFCHAGGMAPTATHAMRRSLRRVLATGKWQMSIA